MIKLLFTWVKFEYRQLSKRLYFRMAKAKADRLHKLDGRRYYVIPTSRMRPVVVNKFDVDAYNKKQGVKKVSIEMLLKTALYVTSQTEGINRK